MTRGLVLNSRGKKKGTSGPRYSLFVSFQKGMQTLIDALVRALPADTIRTGHSVRKIRREGAGPWVLDFEKQASENFDAVCMASPASRASEFLKETAPSLSSELSKISYESVITVNFAYKTEQIRHPLNGFGFVVPRVENKTVIACSFSSRKFEGRAPKGHVLLRAFVGGAFGRHHAEKGDSELLESVRGELAQYLGIQGDPVLSRLQRYPKAMVQYGIGHQDLVQRIDNLAPSFKGLYFLGSSYHGAGIPDCIRGAESQAKKILLT